MTITGLIDNSKKVKVKVLRAFNLGAGEIANKGDTVEIGKSLAFELQTAQRCKILYGRDIVIDPLAEEAPKGKRK